MYFWIVVFALSCFWLLLLGFVFPRMMGVKDTEAGRERVDAIERSGDHLYSARVGAVIGGVSLNGLIRAEVYPGGLLLRPFLMPNVGILVAEIRNVKIVTELYRTGSIEIMHTSQDIVSPLYVYAGFWRRTPFLTALGQITGQPIPD